MSLTTYLEIAVTAVRYDDDESPIVQVQRWEVGTEKLSNKTTKTRQQVTAGIESGDEYTTAFKNDNGKWSLGEDIHVIELDGEKFIRTDQNDESSDNLGGLPRF